MITMAASCGLLSTSGLTLQASKSSPVSNSSKATGIVLAWDPLRKSAICNGSSCYTSTSHSTLLRRQSRMYPASRLPVVRARAGDDDVEVEQISKTVKHGEEGFTFAVLSESARKVFGKMLTSVSNPAVVAMMVVLLLAQPTEDALAGSSGGRMGGKVFSAKPSPGRAYSGGGGGGRSYGGGYAPPLYGSPYGYSPFGFSPFYGGGYGGGLFLGPSIGFGGGGTIILAMIAFATLRSILGFIRDRFSDDNEDDRFDE